jgi:hypothetical protein
MPLFKLSWSTVFDRIVASSSCVASFFTDVEGLAMCSIWKDHPMTSISVFYALKFLWWITGLHSIQKSFISCIALSWLPSFSGEWWSERAWSRLCASSRLKLQSCPKVIQNQSDTCSDRIHNCLDMLWIWYTLLSLFVDPLKKITQPAPSSYATPVAPSAGVTGSTVLSVAKASDFCRRTAEFLEGLKNREVDQQGNPFTPLLFLFFLSL